MAKIDYKIKKIEKGPLQRFKYQNLLIKKFGEVGLQVYKAITGKRTKSELQKDLELDPSMFDQILTYMHDAGMVELEPVGAEMPKEEKKEEETKEETKLPTMEELPEEEKEEIIQPVEEEPKEEKVPPTPTSEEEIELESIEPEESEEKREPEKKEEPFEFEDEIQPISDIEEEVEEEKVEEKPTVEEKKEEEIEEDLVSPEEEIILAPEEEVVEDEKAGLSPVEKIISGKYGDVGLRVYALIDGQRTAEEIMNDTGLTEAKLVEILDFMDEQGIRKLDYPKDRAPPPPPRGSRRRDARPPPRTGGRARTKLTLPKDKGKKEEIGFVPMIEGDESLEEAKGVQSPLETPVKAPLDLVKSVQMKAKAMLKFGDKGSKGLEFVNGKNDVIDISIKLDMPLYKVSEILSYMLENGMIIMKAMSRADVHRKYGDDGYSVYKIYGKEGLMLYELIGKELTIKQMADKITLDRSKIIDMFIFIHQVLGIELPIDKEVLSRQLEL